MGNLKLWKYFQLYRQFENGKQPGFWACVLYIGILQIEMLLKVISMCTHLPGSVCFPNENAHLYYKIQNTAFIGLLANKENICTITAI